MNLTKIQAAIVAEIVTGKIRLNKAEPSYLFGLRQRLLQVKKAIGDEAFDVFMTEAGRPAVHALADIVFDRLTEVNRSETTEKLKTLSMPLRMMVEAWTQDATGMKEGARWNAGLWKFKSQLRTMADLSISGITLADFREGYDEFIHAVVDEVFDRRMQFVS